jgi:hypothetical protein
MEQDEVQGPFAKAYQQVCCQNVDSYKTPTTSKIEHKKKNVQYFKHIFV